MCLRFETRWEHSSFSLKSPDFVPVAPRVAFSGIRQARIENNLFIYLCVNRGTCQISRSTERLQAPMQWCAQCKRTCSICRDSWALATSISLRRSSSCSTTDGSAVGEVERPPAGGVCNRERGKPSVCGLWACV